MNRDVAGWLLCPAHDCKSGPLALTATEVETVEYGRGPVEEVRSGRLECADCGRSYPIEEYVASFEQLFPPDLQREADYWGRWYSFMWDRGYFSYFDLSAPMAPLITEGVDVLSPMTLTGNEVAGMHTMLEQHPLIHDAEWLLDIGCGTGWSSLFLARRGHKVVAFDPSGKNMRLAKRYAMSKGEYIEYIAGALGFVEFKPEVFDGAIGLYSLHHVPDLRKELAGVARWMKDEAGIGIDEHIRDDETLQAIGKGLREWSEREVIPGLRTLPEEALEGLPRHEPSAMEGAGSEDVIEAFLDNFELESFDSRYISLDFMSFRFYLDKLPDEKAYLYASDLVGLLYRFYREENPYNTECATMIGRKRGNRESGESGESAGKVEESEIVAEARRVARGDPRVPKSTLDDALTTLASVVEEAKALEGELARKNAHLAELEGWARGLERALVAEQRLRKRKKGLRRGVRGWAALLSSRRKPGPHD